MNYSEKSHVGVCCRTTQYDHLSCPSWCRAKAWHLSQIVLLECWDASVGVAERWYFEFCTTAPPQGKKLHFVALSEVSVAVNCGRKFGASLRRDFRHPPSCGVPDDEDPGAWCLCLKEKENVLLCSLCTLEISVHLYKQFHDPGAKLTAEKALWKVINSQTSTGEVKAGSPVPG